MAATQSKSVGSSSLLGEMLRFSIYKRHQGRITRQLTFAAIAGTLAIGVYRLSQLLPLWFGGDAATPAGTGDFGLIRFLVPGLLLVAGTWFAFRLVNLPAFADFLIAVETEMTKVSWPTGDEVVRSSTVIIFLIFALAAILAVYDLFWWFVLRAIQGG
jgi:preprotein translocase subunit SecE